MKNPEPKEQSLPAVNSILDGGFNGDLPFAQKNLFNLVIENLPDQIYLKDAESRFILCNTPVALNAGYKSPEDIIGKTDFDLHPLEAEQFFNDEQTLMKLDRSLINHEEQFLDRETNEFRWNLSTKVPIKDNTGKVVGLLGINRDITQMKRALLEREEIMANLVQQAADLKSLNEQITRQKEQELEKAIAQGKFEIASEVLHDIGNALVGFGSYLNRINRALDKDNIATIKNLDLFIKARHTEIAAAIGTDKVTALMAVTEGIVNTQTENKEEISKSINELLNIVTHIQEILNIQRQFVRGREGAHERKPVNLVNIIDDCKAMLFASFDKKGIQLKIDIKPGDYIIKGDHTKLMQVILNVLKNSVEAIDFDAPEKKISIALALYETNKVIELKVIDNGQGFDEETGKRFFERGFTTKKSGTGLGLYNCKSIVESHAGSFEIKSDGPGLGAITIIKFVM
ncbi:MAG TPA: PAS domain-containing sensor histidine kinase [Mucilaginibacter sp.]|jgi:PAS domain S-box-containing protein|nr:PAS domain-containing sensor histidine kinase [Mucilaginibacter sp.]